jgi:hypothetical protein
MLKLDAAAQLGAVQCEPEPERSLSSRHAHGASNTTKPPPSLIAVRTVAASSISELREVKEVIQTQGGGRPGSRIPLVPAEDFKSNFQLSQSCLPQPAWRAWHPSQRFEEEISEVGQRPDLTVISSPSVDHTPIMWFHHAQLQRARMVGANFSVAAGPSQFGGLVPVQMQEIYVNPSSWWKQCEWYRAMSDEYARVERGYKFRYSRIPGGKNGLRTPQEDLKPEWRRVAVKNVQGWAQPRFPELPDAYTEMRVAALYAEGVKQGASDMGILSEIGLYGVTSNCTASAASHQAPNYKPAFDADIAKHLRDERTKKFSGFSMPRLGAPRVEPSGAPERAIPKSGVKQVKAGGQIKIRGTTDPGFERQKRFKLSDGRWHLDGELADMLDAQIDVETASPVQRRKRVFEIVQESSKGANGADSINGNIPDSLSGFEYGSVRRFGQQVDILISSGVPCDLWFEDMASWYEQFPVASTDQWYCTQMVSQQAETDERGCFGYSHYPERTSRFNHAMEELITKRQRTAQAEFLRDGPWTPWSPQTRERTLAFVRRRIALGASGDLFCKNAWFDDNQGAALRPFVAIARRIQRLFWDEFNIDISVEKSKFNPWETEIFEAATGVEIRARLRRVTLPPEKVDKYTLEIEQMVAAAEASAQSLAPRPLVERIIGRAVHACEPIPMLWTILISLITHMAAQASFRNYIKLHAEMRQLLMEMVHLMRHRNGRPLTPYRPRPGCDSFPVIVGASDASRRDGSFFGAGGGWFRFWGTEVVFFFSRQWSVDTVRNANISELEFSAANILARLADDVMRSVHSEAQRYYLFQFGDNESVFKHCLNGFHAGSTGMRRLAYQRARHEYQCQRMTAAAHVLRGENVPGDALANLDEKAFEAAIREQIPSARLVRLAVPAAYAELPP